MFDHKKYLKSLQIVHRVEEEFGIHLVVKNKDTGALHIEGHPLELRDLGSNAILREVPCYHFPTNQEHVNELMKPT